MIYYRSFGDMLTQKRQALGMSLRKLSQKLGFDPTNLSKIERGTMNPPADVEILSKWATTLNILKDNGEYQLFIDWAYLTQRRIPRISL